MKEIKEKREPGRIPGVLRYLNPFYWDQKVIQSIRNTPYRKPRELEKKEDAINRIRSKNMTEVFSRAIFYALIIWVVFIFPFRQAEQRKREEKFEEQQERNKAVLRWYMPNAPIEEDEPQQDVFDDDRDRP